MAKFDPAAWAKKNTGKFGVNCRLIDGTDYEFEFRILTGDKALGIKRKVYELEKRSRQLLKEERQKDKDERDVDVSVELAEIDDTTLRELSRAALATDIEDKDLDQLIVAVGGLNSRFGEAVFRACGISHPKEVVRMMKPDIFEDMPFLSRGKRARTTEK